MMLMVRLYDDVMLRNASAAAGKGFFILISNC
jgi:hypothetical protein